MNKRSGRFFITYFFTSLFLLLLLLPCFPGNASAQKAVDPYYLWHLFTGSAKMESETLSTVVTDEAGNIFIAAAGVKWNPSQETNSDFGSPGQPLHWHSYNSDNNRDILVIKFGPDGEFKWYTYYGGHERDNVRGMAIVDDRLYITGTSRDNWSGPKGKSAVQDHSRAILHPSHCSGAGYYYYEYSDDVFVLALNKYNGEYLWHTFIGESKWNEQVYGIAADKERIFLVGKADAEFFGCWPDTGPNRYGEPMTDCNATQRINRKCRPTRQYQGSNDAWVLALNTNGYYVAHTFLGGSESNDWGEAIAIDKNGMVVVAGSSDQSWNYTHSWYNTPPRNVHSGGYDMFIARLARSDLELHWHAFFGGPDNDWATAVVTDDSNGYYLAGYSKSGWKVKDREPVDPHTEGTNNDFVVVKMNNEGANGWHTFRGGIDTEDVPHAMAMSLYGNTLLVAGEARGPWTLINGKKPLHNFTGASGSTADMAILGLNQLSGKSQWHTFYGSDCIDRAYSIASSVTGDIVVAGVSDKSWKGKDDSGKQVNPKWQFPSEREGLNANFAVLKLRPYKYTIDASVKDGVGGTMDPSGSVAVAYLKDQTFTLKPDTGYMVKQVLVDGKAVTIVNNTYTFEKVAADHTIEVTFEKKTVTISASSPFLSDGRIDPAGNVSVVYGSNKTFTFTPAAGKKVVKISIDGGASQPWSTNTYTFSNVTADHKIAVYFGYIITAEADEGGTITPSGSVGVVSGDDQKFVITPNLGWEIDQVYVNGEKAGNTSQFKFTNVSRDNTIRATFKKKTFTITVSQGQGGTVDPSADVVVSWGDNQDFYITADTANGYVIDTLTADNKTVDAASGKESYKHTFSNVTTNHSISVTFKLKTLVIAASAGAGGTIDPSGNVNVTYGDNKTFTITADTANKYVIDKLLDDGNEVAGVSGSSQCSYPYTNVHSDHTIEARFARHADQYTITASAGTGGTIDPSGSIQVAYGADQTFTITADTANHYAIDKVLVNGNSVPDVSGKATAQYTFHTVSRNSTIEATFKRVFTITAQAGTGGTIDPSGSIPVMGGSDKTFNITADTDNGYRIDELLVDGIKDEAASGLPTYPKTFTNVTSDHSISVTFTQPAIKYIITASAGTGGTISPNGNLEVPAHGSQTFTITPDSGDYQIDKVLVDGKDEGKEAKYTFNDVIQNHTIEATFTKISVPHI